MGGNLEPSPRYSGTKKKQCLAGNMTQIVRYLPSTHETQFDPQYHMLGLLPHTPGILNWEVGAGG